MGRLGAEEHPANTKGRRPCQDELGRSWPWPCDGAALCMRMPVGRRANKQGQQEDHDTLKQLPSTPRTPRRLGLWRARAIALNHLKWRASIPKHRLVNYHGGRNMRRARWRSLPEQRWPEQRPLPAKKLDCASRQKHRAPLRRRGLWSGGGQKHRICNTDIARSMPQTSGAESPAFFGRECIDLQRHGAPWAHHADCGARSLLRLRLQKWHASAPSAMWRTLGGPPNSKRRHRPVASMTSHDPASHLNAFDGRTQKRPGISPHLCAHMRTTRAHTSSGSSRTRSKQCMPKAKAQGAPCQTWRNSPPTGARRPAKRRRRARSMDGPSA